MFMLENKKWQWINLSAFAVMILINLCAELLPIGGRTTREISDMYPSPLTPAPYTFSIWGVIYLLLFAALLLQFWSKGPGIETDQIGIWFLVSCVANIAWIFFWHLLHMSLALLSILVLLLSLFMIETRLHSHNADQFKHWVFRAPFSLYYGWITVAAIANTIVWLNSIGFNGFESPSQLLAAWVTLIGGIIISMIIWATKDPVYASAGLWGYIGILVAQIQSGTAGNYPAWLLLALVISCCAFTIIGIRVWFIDQCKSS